jgi:hypothetical protein
VYCCNTGPCLTRRDESNTRVTVLIDASPWNKLQCYKGPTACKNGPYQVWGRCILCHSRLDSGAVPSASRCSKRPCYQIPRSLTSPVGLTAGLRGNLQCASTG